MALPQSRKSQRSIRKMPEWSYSAPPPPMQSVGSFPGQELFLASRAGAFARFIWARTTRRQPLAQATVNVSALNRNHSREKEG